MGPLSKKNVGGDGAMLSIYQLKPRFVEALRPRAERLHAAGLSANQITILAAVASAVVAAVLEIAAFTGWTVFFVLLPLWMAIRMALAFMDGILAREYGEASSLGVYLNELCDISAECLLYLPFALVAGVSSSGVVLLVVLMVLCEFAGALGPAVGATRRYDGPMGKIERACIFSVLALGVATGWLKTSWCNGILFATALLLIWTLIARVHGGLKEAAAGRSWPLVPPASEPTDQA